MMGDSLLLTVTLLLLSVESSGGRQIMKNVLLKYFWLKRGRVGIQTKHAFLRFFCYDVFDVKHSFMITC